MARNNKSEYRTWPMILEQVRGGRPFQTAAECWVIKECQSLPTRIRNTLTKLGIQFSGDLQYVRAEELKREDGLSYGAVLSLQSMCIAWGVEMGSKAAAPVTWAEATDKAVQVPEAVNHPAHYTPGPFEVYKVLEHFQVLNPYIWNTVKYLSRAHAKDNITQDRAKAAWYLAQLLESGFGFNQPDSCLTHMNSKTPEEIALDAWGCSKETADLIDLVMSPYTSRVTIPADGVIGDYVPQIFRAWRALVGK